MAMDTYIKINSRDGQFGAYVARPNAPVAPCVVVLHEIFGINNDMRQSCKELAEHGFLAVCPDLFWRESPGLELNSWSDAEWKKGLELYAAYDFSIGVGDVEDVVQAVRFQPGSNGKVGVMGFCLGGLVTFLTAARSEVDAAVEYYGGGTERYLAEAHAVEAPFLIHLGEEDEYISKLAQREIEEGFAHMSNVRIVTYPGCSHAFARHTGSHYDEGAAFEANGTTYAFFHQFLG
jgi:carboxymethylenebutenolidase